MRKCVATARFCLWIINYVVPYSDGLVKHADFFDLGSESEIGFHEFASIECSSCCPFRFSDAFSQARGQFVCISECERLNDIPKFWSWDVGEDVADNEWNAGGDAFEKDV